MQHLVHGEHKKQRDINEQCNIAEHLVLDYQAETPTMWQRILVNSYQMCSSQETILVKVQQKRSSFRVRIILSHRGLLTLC